VVKLFIALVSEEELVSIVSNLMVSRRMCSKAIGEKVIEDIMART